MLQDAQWIMPREDTRGICPVFKKNFGIRDSVKSAWLSVSASGVYEARLNGVRVGNFVLAPGCTNYRARLQYQTYDVTDMLGDDNELSIALGTGWFRGRISEGDKEINEKPGAVIAELSIEYEDGSEEHLRTDETWMVYASRVLFSDIYDGETYDASAQERIIGAAEATDKISMDILIPQEGEDVTEHERFKPVKTFITPKGEYVLDFGQNISGYVELELTAKKGDRIVLSHAETLDSDGCFYTENYRSAKAKLEYVCRDGYQRYKPFFTFFGFRYIRVDESPKNILPDCFTAVSVYSDMRRTGYMNTGSEKVNRLYENALWSQRDNFIDIPTDCPQRDERMGWLGDAQIFAKAASYNYDVRRFYAKWMNDVLSAQRSDGSVPDVVPNFWLMDCSSTGWGDAVTIIPWQMYLSYGDTEILKKSFDGMKRWVDYIAADTIEKDLWVCSESDKKLWGKHYGDWLGLDAEPGSYIGKSDIDYIASAFYAHSLSLVVKTGKVLGMDVSKYEDMHGRAVETIKKRFPVLKTQTECVLALHFGLTDDRKATAEKLAGMVRDCGVRLNTGFIGAPYILHALSDNGYAELAYSLLLREEYPSWLYEVNKGATTIWEHWDGIKEDGSFWSADMNSFNHYSYGSVVDWLYSKAAGIRPKEDAPGYSEAVIAPIPDERLGSIEVTLDTEHGTIRSAWRFEDGKAVYDIATPVRTEIIINGETQIVEPGEYSF